MREHIAELAY